MKVGFWERLAGILKYFKVHCPLSVIIWFFSFYKGTSSYVIHGLLSFEISLFGKVFIHYFNVNETCLGNNQKYSAGPQADWNRDLRSLPMFIPGQMHKFAIICPVKFKGSCQDFVSSLQRAARGMSWNIGNPRIFEISDDR